ncbi:hypothetical protein CERSUDRAFT_101551 [Gelatoporia subvermispora B]|uniref:Uncharacterized protein n=1 Tax=Ceriporiopsis subvermispora (strain B) TaxID=914234 RepID=M2Q0E1_CERS8|nr:hypothetical protein CERSUDRAFT_101551 [Gelatoporia subvermispora B]
MRIAWRGSGRSPVVETLMAICTDVGKSKTWISRILQHGTFSDASDDHMETRDAAWRLFDVSALHALRIHLP